MQQKVNPGVAFGVILVVVGIVGFLLWYPNRERPVPNHFGPVSPGQMMQMHPGASGIPAALPAKKVTSHSDTGVKTGSKPQASPADSKDAKDSKPAEGK